MISIQRIQQFLSGKKRRQDSNAVRKSKEKNTSAEPKTGAFAPLSTVPPVADPQESEHVPESDLNAIELAPVGRRGAAAALQRLEEIENARMLA